MGVPSLELAPIEGQKVTMSARPYTASSGTRTLASSTISASVNETNTRLFGDFLRQKMLSCVRGAKDPSRALLGKAFRHFHRGEGHVLTYDEFKEGLGHAFGAKLPVNVIKATFDLFDSDPRTWQVDLDEFCHWLDTGRRTLRDNGVSETVPSNSMVSSKPGESRKFERRPSMEQIEREKMKEHFVKHRSRLHSSKLTDAQKSLVDLMLLEKIKQMAKVGNSEGTRFDTLKAFQKLCGGSGSSSQQSLSLGDFSRQVESLLPDLEDEDELHSLFGRMDANSDDRIDLTDFMIWVDAVGQGFSAFRKRQVGDNFWALEEEENLRRLIHSNTQPGFNPLVPEDYDGSTWLARLGRKKANGVEAKPHTRNPEKGEALRRKLVERVPGRAEGLIRNAFRHFRPAGVGRKLFVEFSEFRESIKESGYGIGDSIIKDTFQYFDPDGTGEIDFAEFRQWLLEAPVPQERKTSVSSRFGRDAEVRAPRSPQELHRELRAKVTASMRGGPHELLRAFRKLTRTKDNCIDASDLREAARSLGIEGVTDEQGRELFNLYDRKQAGTIHFQEFVELVVNNAEAPKLLTQPEREALWRMEMIPQSELDSLETRLRHGLQDLFGARAHECFAAIDVNMEGKVDARGIREGLKLISINDLGERALRQLLSRYSSEESQVLTSPQAPSPTWTFKDFCKFYRPQEAQARLEQSSKRRSASGAKKKVEKKKLSNATLPPDVVRAQRLAAAAADARRPSTADSGTSIKAKLLGQVYGRWKKILRTFQGLDPHRTGLVSREDFQGVLKMSYGLHQMGVDDIKMLVLKHARTTNSGKQMVAYGDFLKSYLETLKAFDLPPASGTRHTRSLKSSGNTRSLRPSTATSSTGGYSKRASSALGIGIHQMMRDDVMRHSKQLSQDLKKRESPYRRGIVSLRDFEEAMRKNGLALDEDDLTQLLGAHQHRGSNGMEPLMKYKEFMRCVSSSAPLLPSLEHRNAPVH